MSLIDRLRMWETKKDGWVSVVPLFYQSNAQQRKVLVQQCASFPNCPKEEAHTVLAQLVEQSNNLYSSLTGARMVSPESDKKHEDDLVCAAQLNTLIETLINNHQLELDAKEFKLSTDTSDRLLFDLQNKRSEDLFGAQGNVLHYWVQTKVVQHLWVEAWVVKTHEHTDTIQMLLNRPRQSDGLSPLQLMVSQVLSDFKKDYSAFGLMILDMHLKMYEQSLVPVLLIALERTPHVFNPTHSGNLVGLVNELERAYNDWSGGWRDMFGQLNNYAQKQRIKEQLTDTGCEKAKRKI